MPFDNSNSQGEPVTPRWQNGVRGTREVASGSFSRPRGSGRLVVRDQGWEVTDSHTRLTLSLVPGHHEPRQTLLPGRPAPAEASSPGVVGVGQEPGRAPTESAAPRTLAALLLLLLSRFSRVRLYATSETAAHQAPPSLGFSRQEHWSGCSAAVAAKSLQSCPTLRPHRR